jgi:uncharacterized protein YidB (DUF937 family)
MVSAARAVPGSAGLHPHRRFGRPRRLDGAMEVGMSEFLGQMMGSLASLLALAQGATGGGLPGLVAQLENAGLAEKVRSWVGHGENLPLTVEELERALPRADVEAWAKEAGTTPEAVLKLLSEALPKLIDEATPEGRLPH